MQSRLPLLTLPLFVAACGTGNDLRQLPEPQPQPKVEKTRFDLRAALGADDVEIVGVAVDPFDGTRYVLDPVRGLYRIDAEGKGTRVVSVEHLIEKQPFQATLTDVVSLGHGKFALTARNDGFLLDVGADTFVQHFCYEPGWLEGRFAPMNVFQSTESLAVDPAAGRIYAQPQTIEVDNESNKLLSQVGVWNLDTGAELEWYDLPDVDFIAEGMIVESNRVLLLAKGNEILRYRLDTATLEVVHNLGSRGVSHLAGMARDESDGRLLVVDAATDELIILPRN